MGQSPARLLALVGLVTLAEPECPMARAAWSLDEAPVLVRTRLDR
jgi:hypothetical protein